MQESTLFLLGSKVFRCLTVVRVVVRHPAIPDMHLHCYQQKMQDGRVRDRNQLPSEKAYAGEAAKVAVERCLLEEMGEHLTAASITYRDDTLVAWDEIVESPSYPGLCTQYCLYQIEASCPTLPTARFVSHEGKKTHSWQWMADRPDDLRRKEGSRPVTAPAHVLRRRRGTCSSRSDAFAASARASRPCSACSSSGPQAACSASHHVA